MLQLHPPLLDRLPDTPGRLAWGVGGALVLEGEFGESEVLLIPGAAASGEGLETWMLVDAEHIVSVRRAQAKAAEAARAHAAARAAELEAERRRDKRKRERAQARAKRKNAELLAKLKAPRPPPAPTPWELERAAALSRLYETDADVRAWIDRYGPPAGFVRAHHHEGPK